MYWPNIAVKYAFWLWCFAAPTAGCVLACAVSQETPCNQRTTCFDLLTLQQANMGYEKYSLHLMFTFYLNGDTSVLELFPVLVFQLKRLSVLTAHAGLAIRQPCSITWDIVVNRQQKLSNSSPHTVNCIICNDHTIIDWMLLNFTQVIQQNCHQPANRAESLRNHFAQLTGWAVKIRNQPIQRRSYFWYRKLCACTWGLNVVLSYSTSSDFCVAKFFWASNMPESSGCWQHHSNLLPNYGPMVSHFATHAMWLVCIDILKIVNWKCTVSVIIHNNSLLSSGSRYCKPEVISWWKVNITVFYKRFLSPTDQKCVESSVFWQFFYYSPPSIQWDKLLKCDAKNSTNIY